MPRPRVVRPGSRADGTLPTRGLARYRPGVSFYPDGETSIPEQTPVPGARPPEDPHRRRTRVFLRMAVINGVVLMAAVLIGFVLPVFEDPDAGVTVVLVAAVLTGIHATATVLGEQRRTRAEGGGGPSTLGGGATVPGGSAGGSTSGGWGAPPAGGAVPPAAGLPYGAVQDAGSVPAGGFSLAIEDVFSITGRGTVATGRVASGSIRVGTRVTVQREGQAIGQSEVTGVEMFRRLTDVASTGDNVGLLLAGISRNDLRRGDVLTA